MSKRRNTNRQKLITLLFALIITIAAVVYATGALNNPPDDQFANTGSAVLSVQFIDVGQADSTLVTLSTGETMLVDAGESSEANAVFEELDERGIRSIDILVATHPHADHIGGMRSVVERYDIGRVLMPDMQSNSKTYKKLIEAIDSKSIPIDEAYAGYRFSLGSAACTVVSPGTDDNKDANNESVVIYLDFDETDFLFTGDMEEWAEARVLNAHYYIDADVLKVAHHGSTTSSTEAFLSEVTPDHAVISCGRDNDYGHPHAEMLDRINETGAEIYRTDVQGDILFTTDGKRLTMSTGD